MKVLLIDIENNVEGEGSSHLIWGHHPIGLMYLASSAQKAISGLSVKIIHTLTVRNPLEWIESTINEFKPDLIGLRSLSFAQSSFNKIAKNIKERHPKVPLIAGGPYASSSFKTILTLGSVDLAVIGEGEVTFNELLRHFADTGALPTELAGTAVVKAGVVSVNAYRDYIVDVDALPFPDYNLINLKDYAHLSNHALQSSAEMALIFSSRGCPYHCFYCHQNFGKNIRRRSAQNVVDEMKGHVQERGVKHFVFVDDTFNVPMAGAKDVLRLIAKELPGVHLSFPNGLRADCLDHEMLQLFEDAGTQQMTLAVETATPRIQKMIGKNLNLEKAKRWIQLASEKIIVRAFFMIGFPSETKEEAMETIKFARELKCISLPMLSIVRVYEGTSLYTALAPTEEQARMLIRQQEEMLLPKAMENVNFYGDIFPVDKVPLRGGDIQALRWEWIKEVTFDKERTKNTYILLTKHYSTDQILKFYQTVFENPQFNERSLKKLINF